MQVSVSGYDFRHSRGATMSFQADLKQFSPQVFPASYQGGRGLWAAALAALAGPVAGRDFAHPEDPELVCQTAWIGDPAASRVVVVIAGTHGVEGFVGTAIEVDFLGLLTTGDLRLPEDTAALLVNALNPWGYAHCRRCDHEGIDTNRNFIDFSRPPPANTGYLRLMPIFAIEDHQRRLQLLAEQASAMGQRDYEIAFSGGQFSDPGGPFYGGAAPGFSRRVIEALMADHQLGSRRLAVVDIHSGLGPFGYGEVICDHPAASAGIEVAFSWYGDACTLPASGTSSSVPKLGLLDYAWHRIMDSNSCFVTLEFGTLGTGPLFEVLLDEARLWARGDEDNIRERQQMAERMRAHFYPQDPWWREAVIFRGRQVLRQALAGVAA